MGEWRRKFSSLRGHELFPSLGAGAVSGKEQEIVLWGCGTPLSCYEFWLLRERIDLCGVVRSQLLALNAAHYME